MPIALLWLVLGAPASVPSAVPASGPAQAPPSAAAPSASAPTTSPATFGAELLEVSRQGPALVLLIELRNDGMERRPIKPMPIRLLRRGRRIGRVDPAFYAITVAEDTDLRGAGEGFPMELAAGETVRIRVPTKPLRSRFWAARGLSVSMELKSPGANATVEAPVP